MSSPRTSTGVSKEDALQNVLPVEETLHDNYRWTALSVTTVGALLASIQGSALLIALPNILTELRITFFTIIWVLLGYLLVLTVLTPIIGRLADIWGRKRLYNAGFAVFTLGSLLSGIAQPQFHGGDLIIGRLIQGAGASLLLTNRYLLLWWMRSRKAVLV